MQHWTQDCQTEATNATILCRCVSPAFVTVFRKRNGAASGSGVPGSYQSTPTLPTRPSTKPPSKPDISVFFGFPYDRDIYITGEVFKAISLTCLVITVSAYTICRKARKGATTNILLNLCVSLIVLIIVLYIAAYEANSEIGCRVLNVLRYYLALVSLLWNAVEAHNMYRMLVKVFHAETSHFVLIAGIFAWGLPMLAVGIILAINIRAFDGSYEDDDAECTFRCALRFETRLYGWIVPMSIIILHNLIVFAMVLKVICRTNTLQASGQTKGRSAGKRLCGALTMLVLLGFPWIISVFGLIDTPSNSAGVLQKACSGLLVIFVGLQGLFIFHFHCVRNRTIRDLTKTHINTSLLTLKRSTSKSGVSSPNKSNAITASTRDVQNSTSMQDVTNSTSMQDAENSTLMQDVENGTSMQDVQNSTSMQVVENTTSTQDVQNSTSTQDVQNSTSM